MPMTLEEHTTRGGNKIIRTYSEGRVGPEDAERYVQTFCIGMPRYGWSSMSVSSKSTEFTPEARKIFSSLENVDQNAFSAVVLHSTVMRVTVGFILKVRPSANTRIFATEVEAEEWLDARLAERAAAAKSS